MITSQVVSSQDIKIEIWNKIHKFAMNRKNAITWMIMDPFDKVNNISYQSTYMHRIHNDFSSIAYSWKHKTIDTKLLNWTLYLDRTYYKRVLFPSNADKTQQKRVQSNTSKKRPHDDSNMPQNKRKKNRIKHFLKFRSVLSKY
jgi:hypothetical protein